MARIERYCAPGVLDPAGRPAHRGDIAVQAREAFRAIKAQVEAGGGTMASIVKGPASTLVAVAALAHSDWLIEVEAIAVV